MTNSKGPRQEPWGTPQASKNCLESDPSMDTCWLRFDRYELKESSTFPRIPISLSSRSNEILWSTVSNAALRSNRTIRVTCCGFIFKRTSFISLSYAVSVPSCDDRTIADQDTFLLTTMCSCSVWLNTTFSESLEKSCRLLTDLKSKLLQQSIN